MGIQRSEINCDRILVATRQLLEMSHRAGLTTNFGGNIGIDSIPFMRSLGNVADRFETRKVVLRMDDNTDRLKKAIAKALEFELLYLLDKRDHYASLSREDESRINRMKNQLGITL